MPTFTPASEKQKGMLFYQLKSTHDGAFEQDHGLDRRLVERLKELNDAGTLDRSDTSDLISCLLQFNDAKLGMNPRMVESTNKFLAHILSFYKNV